MDMSKKELLSMDYWTILYRFLSTQKRLFVQRLHDETSHYEQNSSAIGRPGYLERYNVAYALTQLAYRRHARALKRE